MATLTLQIVLAEVPTGFKGALDIGVIEQAKDVYFDYVLNILKNVNIPDIDFKGGYIRDN